MFKHLRWGVTKQVTKSEGNMQFLLKQFNLILV